MMTEQFGGNGMEPLEIEHKYIIYMPDVAALDAMEGEKWDVRQVYLTGTPEQGSRRIRRIRDGAGERWYYSEKVRLSATTRIERERQVSGEEAAKLLLEADPEKRPIEKRRWRIPYMGKLIEIDVFPFWAHQAFCEVELEREDEEFSLPDWVRVYREVSAENRYNNNNLARSIPEEEVPHA